MAMANCDPRPTRSNRGILLDSDDALVVVGFTLPMRKFGDDRQDVVDRREPDAWLAEQRAERYEAWLSARLREIAEIATCADAGWDDGIPWDPFGLDQPASW